MNHQDSFNEFEKLFWRISRKMGYLWKRIYESTFPGSQSHILFLLERNGPKKMSELAVALDLTPGAVTTASDRLLEQGYIARKRDENDRRVIYVELTEKGKETLNKLQIKGRAIMKTVFSHLSEKELEEFNILFTKASNNLDNLGKDFDQ